MQSEWALLRNPFRVHFAMISVSSPALASVSRPVTGLHPVPPDFTTSGDAVPSRYKGSSGERP